MICYIYKITCLCGSFKDHYYIGQRQYNGKNIGRDKYTGSGKLIKDYFKKYGFDQTYIKQILEVVPTKELLNQREKFYVGDLWETDDLCLNRVAGGNKFGYSLETRKAMSEGLKKYYKEHPFPKDRKEKLSMRFKGEGNPWYGKRRSEETKEKMRRNSPRNKGVNNHRWGKKMDEKHLKERSEISKKLWEDPNYRKKVLSSKAKSFNGINHPSKRKDVSSKISNSLKKYYLEHPERKLSISKNKGRKIVRFNGDGEKVFNSSRECVLSMGLSKASAVRITECCKGLRDSWRGYKFKYIDNE